MDFAITNKEKEMSRFWCHFVWTFRALHHCFCEMKTGWGYQIIYMDYGKCAFCGKWMSGFEHAAKGKVK